MTAATVVVVGAGVVGACTAYELARRGEDVLVLDRGGAWGDGCSWGNAGLIVPSHARPIAAPENLRAGLRWALRRDSPFGLRLRPELLPWVARYARAATARRASASERLQRQLAVESLERFRALAHDGVDGGLEQRGCLTVFAGPRGPRRAAHEAASETGRALGARALSGADARELEPTLTASATAGVFYPREAHCDPGRFVAAVGAAAEARGARLSPGVDVRGLRAERRRVLVQTPTGPLYARQAVIAAGAWSGRLARTLGVNLPLQGGKGYAVEYAPAALPLRLPLYLHDDRCVVTPLGDRARMTGGLLLDGLDERVDPRRLAAIRRAAARMLGVEGVAPRWSWRGLRPCTPDGLPAIGPHRAAEGVVFATGHGMLGVTLGPLTGGMVADVVTGKAPHPALGRLSPERFGR